MKKSTIWILAIISMLVLSSCGKFEDITIHGIKGFKLRGIKNGHILINLTLDIENPNNRKITISKIHFKAWLKNRELGTLKNSKKIVLPAKTRSDLEVPVEIVLRTAADIFKLATIKEDLINQLTIEGYIKGRTLCISKKVRIEKQPFTELAKSYKGRILTRDSLQTGDTIPPIDSLKIE